MDLKKLSGKPFKQASTATLVFLVFGIYGYVRSATNVLALPETIFYVLLVCNTYFSIYFFATVIKPSLKQNIVNVVLVLAYADLASYIGTPIAFPACATALFVLATGKYKIELRRSQYPQTLKRKIRADVLGAAVLCVLAIVSGLGFALIGEWILVAIFVSVNLYTLLLRPLYRVID